MRVPTYLLAAGAIGACCCATPDGSAPASEAQSVSPTSFAVAAGDCETAGCGILLQLLADGRVLDSALLDFKASNAELTEDEVGPLMGASDPLAPSAPREAFVAGEEEGLVATALLPLRLSGERAGVLVHQMAGFDHVKRRHYVFTVAGDRLRRVWSSEEGAGPTWSAAFAVEEVDASGESVIYMEGFQPGGEQTDRLSAVRLGWDPDEDLLVPSGPAQLFAIVAGRYASSSEARAAAAAQACLSSYWALPAERAGMESPGVVLALVSIDESWAQAALDREAGACQGSLEPSLVRLETPSPGL